MRCSWLKRGLVNALLALTTLLVSTAALAQNFPDPLVNSAQVTLPAGISDPVPGNNTAQDSNALAEATVDAVDDTATTGNATPATTVVGANDVATGGTLGAITGNTQGTNGSVSCSGTGTTASCTYTPNAGFSGPDSYTYTICLASPNEAICDTATVSVVVGPDAVDDVASTTQNTPVSGDVSGNDVYPVGSVFASTGTPVGGTVVVNADGTYTFTPTAGFTGAGSFQYTVCLPAPNGSVCDTATVSVSVGAASVDAVDDTATTGNATPATTVVGANDVATGGTLGAITGNTQGTNGSVSCSGTGTTASCTYTPNAGFSGPDSYTYTICLASPNEAICDTATVSVVVGPDAVDDVASTTQNTPVSGDVSGNDVYPVGSVFASTGTPVGGTVVVNADGTYTFTPTAGFTGAGSFQYTVCLPAPNGSVCDTATVSVSVGAASVDAVDDTATTGNATPATTVVGANDVATGGTLGAITGNTQGTNGSVSCSGTGTTASCTYTPNAGFSGPDSYTYTICLASPNEAICDTATVSVVVGPDAVDDVASTTQNTPVSGDVSGNDVYPVGSVFASTGTPVGGTVVVNADGTYTFTPTAGFTGAGSFQYTVCLPAPNGSVCDTATVSVSVGAASVDAVDDTATTGNATPATTVVGANDVATGGTLGAITGNTQGTNGSVSCSGTGTTASCTYTPNAGFSGPDSYTYTICLASPNEAICDTATVSVVVGPDAVDDVASTTQNTPVSGDVSGNDVYPVGSVFASTGTPVGGTVVVNADGTYTFTPTAGFTGAGSFQYTVCLPAPNGSVCDTATVSVSVGAASVDAVDDTATTGNATPATTVVGANDVATGGTLGAITGNTQGTNGSVSCSGTGTTASCTYTPNAGFSGPDSYTYTICLASPNEAICDTATVSVVVGPDAVDDVASTTQNTPVSGDVSGNDVYPVGSVFASTGTPVGGTVVVNADGTYTFTPTAGFTGAGSFQYTVCLPAPNGSVCDTATVSVSVGAASVSDLSMVKTLLTGSPATAGSMVSYQLVVSNAGPGRGGGRDDYRHGACGTVERDVDVRGVGTSSCGTARLAAAMRSA